MISLVAITGARPQFIKHAALLMAAPSFPKIKIKTLHTGQHYDHEMDELFFNEFNLPPPEYKFEMKTNSSVDQTAQMMLNIEEVFSTGQPDGVIVYGDTNSTLAGAMVAVKMGIPLFHVEAGLRSFNRNMPEEINRIIVDRISNVLYLPSKAAMENTTSENLIGESVLVGDIMKDICIATRKLLSQKEDQKYIYASLHRPSNVDHKDRFTEILSLLNHLELPVIFTIHPRTNQRLKDFNIDIQKYKNIKAIAPQSYKDNLRYLNFSEYLITDSGGLQKEAYWLQKKCITVRKDTEWTETLNGNWNQLYFNLNEAFPMHILPDSNHYDDKLYGKGNTADRILIHLQSYFSGPNGNNSETKH